MAKDKKGCIVVTEVFYVYSRIERLSKHILDKERLSPFTVTKRNSKASRLV